MKTLKKTLTKILTYPLIVLSVIGFIFGICFLAMFYPRRVREEDLIYERE
jgi:type II secretory pathway component PulF